MLTVTPVTVLISAAVYVFVYVMSVWVNGVYCCNIDLYTCTVHNTVNL